MTPRATGAQIFAARQPTTTSQQDDLFLLLLSADPAALSFTLPEAKVNGRWKVVFDTAQPADVEPERFLEPKAAYRLSPRSFVLLHDV